MLGVKWRISQYQAEALLRELNDGQFGSQPRQNAPDPVFIEELQFDMSRASRKMMAQANYNATLCYDRIIQNLAMIVSRKFGVLKQVAQSNASILELAGRIPNAHGTWRLGYRPCAFAVVHHFRHGTRKWKFTTDLLFHVAGVWCLIVTSPSIGQQYIVIRTALHKWNLPWWDSLMITKARQIHSCMQSRTIHCQRCYGIFDIMRKHGRYSWSDGWSSRTVQMLLPPDVLEVNSER